MHCFSFDIETIPDTEFGRRMWDLEGLSDEDVGTAMTFLRQQQTGSDFLPLHLHKVVAISVAFRSGDGFRVWSLGERDADEAEIIGRFFEGISGPQFASHRAFRPLGSWGRRTGTPVRALLAQAAITIALVVALGSFIDTVIYTAAPVYTFFLATSLAIIVLRRREPQLDRPYRVLGYPVTTLVFCAVCAFLIYSAVAYKPLISAISYGLILLGLPIYWLTTRRPTTRTRPMF